MGCSRDAEANEMIHMGSEYRSVMTTFVIKAHRKNDSRETLNAKQRSNTVQNTKEHTDDKEGSKEAIMFDQPLEEKIKYKARAAEIDQKKNVTE